MSRLCGWDMALCRSAILHNGFRVRLFMPAPRRTLNSMNDNRRDASHGARLLAAWNRLSGRPGGKWLFSRLVGRMAPYTGTIKALVLELEPGRAVVELKDRRAVRNHLRSIHAIALANLGELSSGLAASAAMPQGVRGIPTAIAIDYHHKARGTLTATGTAVLPDVTEPTTAQVQSEIRDRSGSIVTTVTVTWQLERV
jgi:acyl-coenzyme A thioesterase PaaI-like protein